MRVFCIDQNMDRDGMLKLKPAFDELARSSTDVCLDLSGVQCLDESGVEEMALLHRRLRGRSLKLAIINAGEQPLSFLRDLMLERWTALADPRATNSEGVRRERRTGTPKTTGRLE